MTKDEALKLALEALEPRPGMPCPEYESLTKCAITAIREALAQPETVSPGGGLVPAVPVAVYGYCPVCGGAGVMRERRPNGDDKCTNGHKYPSSKALAQPEQEPVAWMDEFGNVFPLGAQRGPKHLNEPMKPLYTAPPHRKPLTDEEIEREWQFLHDEEGNPPDHHDFARAIEAAHGITGEQHG